MRGIYKNGIFHPTDRNAQSNNNGEEGSGKSVPNNKLSVNSCSQMKIKNTKQTNNSDQTPVVETQINSSLTLTYVDTDVYDCPICSDPLTIPVFQCKNGHLVCSACCIKLKNKCPSCCTQIENTRCRAIEKVLESLKIPCPNTPYGCKEILLYSGKCIHEKMCIHLPCSCPLVTCNFVGTSTDLATHCRSNHCFQKILYDKKNDVVMKFSEEYKFLQEQKEGTVFIIRNKKHHDVNAFSVSCIGPPYMRDGFSHDLIARTCLRLRSTTDFVQALPTDKREDLSESLIVPRDKPDITLILWIWKDDEQPGLMDIREKQVKAVSVPPNKLNIEPVKKRKYDTFKPKRPMKKRKKDTSKPKRPMTAFFFFLQDFRISHKEKFPANKFVSVVSKASAEKWKAMSPSEKAPYVAKAEKQKAEYAKVMEEFNKKKLNDNGEQKTEESDTSSSDNSSSDDTEQETST